MEYRLVLEPDLDGRYRGFPAVLVGRADLDPRTWHGPDDALIVPSLPGMLRTFADQIESAMTTGPDEARWLAQETTAAELREARQGGPAPEKAQTIGDSIREHGWGGPSADAARTLERALKDVAREWAYGYPDHAGCTPTPGDGGWTEEQTERPDGTAS
jgi:hypothetical protein